MANNDLIQQFEAFLASRAIFLCSGPVASTTQHHDPKKVFRDFINSRPRAHMVRWDRMEDDWEIEHPIYCRLQGSLLDCDVHMAMCGSQSESCLLKNYPKGTYRILQNAEQFHIEKVG